MNSFRQNMELQRDEHPLVPTDRFGTIEQFVSQLMHQKAYQETLALAEGKFVLDWGCNNGYGIEVLQTSARQVAGLDLSPSAIAAARQRFDSDPVELELFDGKRTTFHSGRFDLVTSFQVIEHVADYDAYLSEIVRVLNPDGGMAIFTTPNAGIRLDPGMTPWNRFHVREFRPSELHDMLSDWFCEVEIRGMFGVEPIYKVERQRCEHAKLRGKQRKTVFGKARGMLRNAIPDELFNVISKPTSLLHSQWRFTNEFSIDDLFYRKDNLNNALDLMAICRL